MGGKNLDQFFTKSMVAEACWREMFPMVKNLLKCNDESLLFIEPSAGHGAFYDLFPRASRKIGIDIDSKRKQFIKNDFLTWSPNESIPNSKNVIVVGNPPFGKKSKLAVDFFNKAAGIADTVGFIVPVIFRKYFIHKSLNRDFRWIRSIEILPNSFWTDEQENYSVNCEFQIWTRHNSKHKNMRLFSPPAISHNDFIMYQYNNTRQMLKVFDEKFDFAVPSQGWQDYNRRETSPDNCEKNKQWMLFKTLNGTAYQRLYSEIDFELLARKYTTIVPGFRKGDVVTEYRSHYG